jgi:hypothetical protein
MLDLLHINEVSYEGNDRVIKEWFQQLTLDAEGNQLLVWAGDQLMVLRIQGLKKFHCMNCTLICLGAVFGGTGMGSTKFTWGLPLSLLRRGWARAGAILVLGGTSSPRSAWGRARGAMGIL